MRGPDAIERSHRKLFLALQKELRYLESAKASSIRAYERAFKRSLPARSTTTTKAALVSRAKGAEVILVGDFHPFRQSQKGFLRLLKEVRGRSARPSAIALECIQQEFQTHVDYYLQGLITAEELREETAFEDNWPFPWENYRELLEYAKAEKIPVVPLNIPGRGAPGELKARDEAAAQRIAEVAAESPKLQIFTLYGELHLAAPHLPASLRSRIKKRVLIVHQNETQLYWSAPRLKNGDRPEVLRLREDEYCVLNAVPWMKLRAFLDWAEGSQEDDWDDSSDINGPVAHFAALLAEALLLEAPALDRIETRGPDELEEGGVFARSDRPLFAHARKYHRVSYLPAAQAVVVPTLSTNALTEAAALHLWARHNGGAQSQLGARLILQFMAGFLGSKLLNPKRKCNEEADMEAYLARLPREKRALDAKGRIFQRALGILKPLLHGKRSTAAPLDGGREIEALRLAGFVLGNRLSVSLRRSKSAARITQELFTSTVADPKVAAKLLNRIGAEIRAQSVAPSGKESGF
ncbi:MAG: hypothetical protein EOP11_06495 [Proteobacteria bacterium]|nr:MAG: hypothetical protein EOP11_06495 [Pseudomonadota bacterium]